jgi:hypothetical protein
MLYRRTDDVERLKKVVADTEQQFTDYIQQIKTLGEASERHLLERLLRVPQKVVKFLTEAPVACVSHALTFVKSCWPEAQLEMFTQGVAAECTEDQFNEYLQEAQPVAEQIVKNVLQD